jgi:hypothetical protein
MPFRPDDLTLMSGESVELPIVSPYECHGAPANQLTVEFSLPIQTDVWSRIVHYPCCVCGTPGYGATVVLIQPSHPTRVEARTKKLILSLDHYCPHPFRHQ